MIFSILVLIVLIFINGMFASAELAFLSLDKAKLNDDVKKGDKKAKTISKIGYIASGIAALSYLFYMIFMKAATRCCRFLFLINLGFSLHFFVLVI